MERVVVCPYCESSLPHPDQVGLTYRCSCGAVFALFPEYDLGSGLADLVEGLFEDNNQSLGRKMEQCQVTVYQDYEAMPECGSSSVLADFIKQTRFNPGSEGLVHLVWVSREDHFQEQDVFGQIQN